MTTENFAFWLQGFFELQGVKPGEGLSSAQTDAIREHLALVFTKVTGWQSPPPPPWTPASPFAPPALPANPYPWRDSRPMCAAAPQVPLVPYAPSQPWRPGESWPTDRNAVTVTDDVEAGLSPADFAGLPCGQPMSFVPVQVGGWAAEPRESVVGGHLSSVWPTGDCGRGVYVGPQTPPSC